MKKKIELLIISNDKCLKIEMATNSMAFTQDLL